MDTFGFGGNGTWPPRCLLTKGLEPSQSHLILLLLGEKHSGKSSAGNTILGRNAFQTSTARSAKERGSVCGKQVTVVDTPGWSSRSTNPESVSRELSRGLALCHPEAHAILLVLSITATFGRVEWGATEAQLRLFHTPIWQRAMILFTHGDKLGRLPIQEYIRQQGRSLQWLVERCGYRYQVLSSQPGASEAQVMELFEKIQTMVAVNMRPREMQQRMYTLMREDVMREEERKSWEEQEGMEMAVMYDGMPMQRRWMGSGPPYLPRGPAAVKPGLSLVLLGRRRSAKSSAGNIVLGRPEFQRGKKTLSCTVGHGEVLGCSVTVVDTPGWSVFGLANPEVVRMEMRRSASLCPPRSKVTFLLAIPVDSFREKDRRAVEKYVGVLGDEVWRSTVVLFTYGQHLGGRTVEEHIEKKGEPLQWVLERCGHRYHVFHTDTADQAQAPQLLEMVEQL